MGLKDDIYTALITNIQPEGVEENFDFTDKANRKVETLAQDLTNAINPTAKMFEGVLF